MFKLSLMYKQSGGCGPNTRCSKCCNLKSDEKWKKSYRCVRYSYNDDSVQSLWNENWPACAWFNQPGEPVHIRKSQAHRKTSDTKHKEPPVQQTAQMHQNSE